MINIYSADPENGILYTDEKQHYYIDGELLREKAMEIRTKYLLDEIAKAAGFAGYPEMDTFLRCSGITRETFDSWVASGTMAKNLNLLS